MAETTPTVERVTDVLARPKALTSVIILGCGGGERRRRRRNRERGVGKRGRRRGGSPKSLMI